MKPWVAYAVLSAVFAGATSVIAKLGMSGVSGELGVAVRTCFVFALVLAYTLVAVPSGQWSGLTTGNLFWLGLSGATTAVSWLCYYKAIEQGEVSTVALIDKGGVLVAVILAAIVLKEQITARTLAGGACLLAGLVILAKK